MAPAAGVEQTKKEAAMTTVTNEIEDIVDALKAGRKPRDHGPYKVLVGDNDLNYSAAIINDPTPIRFLQEQAHRRFPPRKRRERRGLRFL